MHFWKSLLRLADAATYRVSFMPGGYGFQAHFARALTEPLFPTPVPAGTRGALSSSRRGHTTAVCRPVPLGLRWKQEEEMGQDSPNGIACADASGKLAPKFRPKF